MHCALCGSNEHHTTSCYLLEHPLPVKNDNLRPEYQFDVVDVILFGVVVIFAVATVFWFSW